MDANRAMNNLVKRLRCAFPNLLEVSFTQVEGCHQLTIRHPPDTPASTRRAVSKFLGVPLQRCHIGSESDFALFAFDHEVADLLPISRNPFPRFLRFMFHAFCLVILLLVPVQHWITC